MENPEDQISTITFWLFFNRKLLVVYLPFRTSSEYTSSLAIVCCLDRYETRAEPNTRIGQVYWSMVSILEGCSFHYAHIWSKSDISICWRHLATTRRQLRKIFRKKSYFTSYVRNMFWANILYKYYGTGLAPGTGSYLARQCTWKCTFNTG